MGCMFAPVSVEIACYDPETVGCMYKLIEKCLPNCVTI